MGVKIKFRYPRPDFKKTTDAVHETMTKFIIETLKTWVLETVKPIPVWSGAARASFLFLAAKAMTSIKINPVAPTPPGSRIFLGVSEAEAEVIADKKSGIYGWTWRSTLAHIGVVEDRVQFVSAGERAIKGKTPELPKIITRTTRKRG